MDYIFDTGSELGHHHLDHLGKLLDTPTTWRLERLGLRSDMRCLELGAGSGSIANWLAARTREVVAVDIDTAQLYDVAPGVQVIRHDLRDGLPVDGPFDLIHARLTMLHLPQREELFGRLVEALAPGGRLVFGDITDRPLEAIAVPEPADRDLWDKVLHLSHEVVSPARGISWTWARETADRMTTAGLVDIEIMEYSQTTTGGTDGCLLHRNLNQQAEPLLLAAGATPAELTRYRALMTNPDFKAWFYQFLMTSGRRRSGV
ncbi:methyltransferase domain-containing protein [Kribbella sp. NPDC050281]|uniref:methyltransferase domain-containing protein n=1 Tax=Kribbella sp. NPDC050281 TaxID=3155515 RepID=UPI0033DA86D4